MTEIDYRELVETANDIIYAHDLEGRFTWVNGACEPVTGYTRDEALRLSIWDLVAPDHAERTRSAIEKRLTEKPQVYELEILAKDGRRIPLELSSRLVYRGDRAVGVQGIARDVTERRLAARALEASEGRLRGLVQQIRESEERYAVAARGSNDGLWDWDLRKNELHLSERFQEQLGETALAASPEAWFDRLHPDDRERFFKDLDEHLQSTTPHLELEARTRHADGTYRFMLVRGAAVREADGKAVRLAGSQTDITARKEAEEKLLHDGLHDGLTGLPNRSLFMDRLGQAMAFQRRRTEYRWAVIFLDIDRFKNINGSLGHLKADRLLENVAERLLSCLTPGDTAARPGGDEFTVLLEDFTDPAEPGLVAERIQQALGAPHDLEGVEVFASASIGIAIGSPQYSRPEDLLRDADTAMYRAKELGGARQVVFHPSMHAHARARLQLESDLRRALERSEFRLRYQPVVSLDTLAVTGCEALLSWEHPTRGRVPPGDFISLAEETGLIVPLGEWALREACTAAQSWPAGLGAAPISVSVNLSGKQLLRSDLLGQVRSALADSGLDAGRLRLEITESVLMEHAGPATALLGQLKALGVHLLLDDFGTGYSSLSYLHHFRFDTLKIDRSFVARMETQGKQAEIVRTIIALARTLGMDVVAEGVETQAQLATLRALGCDQAQGFLFSRAIDSADLAKLLVTPRP